MPADLTIPTEPFGPGRTNYYGSGIFLIRTGGINLAALGITDIFTVPAGKSFILQDGYMIFTNVVGASANASGGPIDSGSGSAVLTSTTYSFASAIVGRYAGFSRGATSFPLITAGNKLQYSVTTAGTATTWLGDFCAFGYLI